MGLFGKNKNDLTSLNDANKQQIISDIGSIMRNSRGEITAMLKDIQLEIQSHGQSGSEEVLRQDMQIKKLLGEINEAVVKGRDSMVITKLGQVKTAVANRKIHCGAGGQLTKADAKAAKAQAKLEKKLAKKNKLGEIEQTRTESLQEKLDEENAKLEDLRKTLMALHERHKKNPADQSIVAQATTISMQIKASEAIIQKYTAEIQREGIADIYSSTVQIGETLTQGRTVSNDQMDVLREAMQSQNEAMAADVQQNQADMANFGAINALGAMGNPFEAANAGAVTFADPFAGLEGAGSAMGAQSSQARQTQYGGFDASEMGSREMMQDINKTKQSLQQSMDAYNDKMDDLSDELSDLNAQLKPLLIKRETASPSECMVLDGQIDQLNAKRNSVQYTIKRTRQALSTLQEQMSLMERLSTQQDLEATNAKIQQMTGGRFADFEGLAMFLKDSVARSNEQLEEIGTATMVADSEEINMNTFSGSSAVFSDTMGNKDENRYDALKRDLGLMN